MTQDFSEALRGESAGEFPKDGLSSVSPYHVSIIGIRREAVWKTPSSQLRARKKEKVKYMTWHGWPIMCERAGLSWKETARAEEREGGLRASRS